MKIFTSILLKNPTALKDLCKTTEVKHHFLNKQHN